LAYSAQFFDQAAVHQGWIPRKGIGTRAQEFLKDAARTLGVTALRLEVELKNASAHGLYRRAGFEDHDRHLRRSG
jgi:ribosomal protein S18 acetylase RimI-like enzyme